MEETSATEEKGIWDANVDPAIVNTDSTWI